MKFQYNCNKCSGKKKKSYPEKKGYEIVGFNDETKEFLFCVEAPIGKAPEAKKVACPNCGLKECDRSFTDIGITMFYRGQGIVNDKDGAKRDMNAFTLKHKDPYGHMRQSGEKDDMLDRLRRAGLDMSKVKKHSNEEAAALKAKINDDTTEEIIEFNKLSGISKTVLMIIFEDVMNEVSYSTFVDRFKDEEMEENNSIDNILSDLLHKHKLIIKRKNGNFSFMPGTFNLIENYKLFFSI